MILTESSRRQRRAWRRGGRRGPHHNTSLTRQRVEAARACTRRATWPCPCQRAAIDREPAARRPATDAGAVRAHRPLHSARAPHTPAPGRSRSCGGAGEPSPGNFLTLLGKSRVRTRFLLIQLTLDKHS